MQGSKVVVCALFVVGMGACSDPTAVGVDASALDAREPIAIPLTGATGALVITSANTIVNQYGVLAANAAVGDTSITITSAADFPATAPFTTTLGAGDLLLLYQPQGATINSTTTLATYGSVTAYGSAGNYELVHVVSVAGTTINLETTCSGLRSAFTTAGATQVIRVPQATTLAVSGVGSITAPAWDGARGGVVALHA
ncbi:MAG: hypothetical protein NT062_20535, partial [Proteobacteria bacterium]|nr:hypothetical protein [Pseudomonadota bacterium]